MGLDKRYPRKDSRYLLRIFFNHKDSNAVFTTKIYLQADQWNSETRHVISHPLANAYNKLIQEKLAKIEYFLISLDNAKNNDRIKMLPN
ncbi:MAG: hypothetical protein LBR45_02765 [Bacteroidales bacterium]|nr:hypothetical protein [Bacteroidales bacterium]